MKIIICTRDLKYGVGTHILTLLKEFEKIDEIERVLVIGPQILGNFSPKIQFEILEAIGGYFITKQPFFAIECRKRIEKILKREKYDLIHTHYPLFAKDFGIPLIITFHTLNYFATIGYYISDYKLKIGNFFHRIYEIFDRSSIKYSIRIIFVSNNALKMAKSRYKNSTNKFIHISNFIEISKFFPLNENKKIILRKKYGLSVDKNYILFVGRLEPLKGILNLVYAINEINQKYKDIKLLVVGDGILKAQISKFDFVKCLGRIPNQSMGEIYNVSDFFILPSFYENSPMTILEAMSCGLPVISTDTGDIKELIDDDRMIIKVNELGILTIKQKVEFLLNLPKEDLEKIRNQNRQRVIDHYSRNKNVAKILEVYKDVTKK